MSARLGFVALFLVCIFLSSSFINTTEVVSSTYEGAAVARNSTSFQILTKRGGGFMTTLSGCRIARYLYTIEDAAYHKANPKIQYPNWNECSKYPRPQDELNGPIMGEGVQTIFVPITALDQFVDRILDMMFTDIVVISSRTWLSEGASNLTIQKLLNNTHVLHWFCTNLPILGGPNPHHHKISPWPYGLTEIGAEGTIAHEKYKKVYTEQWNKSNSTKSTSIYAGPLSTKDGRRSNIPNSPRLPPEDFFIKLAEANYVLSPNGDRPDCHRHYEAIGLGTVPITQLDPILYRHLVDGPAVFNNSDWNLQSLESKLEPHPIVNRDLVLEDYWMDYADRVVGKKMNWSTKFDEATT